MFKTKLRTSLTRINRKEETRENRNRSDRGHKCNKLSHYRNIQELKVTDLWWHQMSISCQISVWHLAPKGVRAEQMCGGNRGGQHPHLLLILYLIPCLLLSFSRLIAFLNSLLILRCTGGEFSRLCRRGNICSRAGVQLSIRPGGDFGCRSTDALLSAYIC